MLLIHHAKVTRHIAPVDDARLRRMYGFEALKYNNKAFFNGSNDRSAVFCCSYHTIRFDIFNFIPIDHFQIGHLILETPLEQTIQAFRLLLVHRHY